MKLTATMMLTLDGVYQGPGSPDTDRRGGFERGGWVAPHFDEETGRFVTSVFERADALLLGRSRRRSASSRRSPDASSRYGSGALLRWLLERDLVDELDLQLYPVVAGDGRRYR